MLLNNLKACFNIIHIINSHSLNSEPFLDANKLWVKMMESFFPENPSQICSTYTNFLNHYMELEIKQLRMLAALAKDPSLVSNPHIRQLTTAWNFISKRPNTLFWLLQAPTHTAYTNPYMHESLN